MKKVVEAVATIIERVCLRCGWKWFQRSPGLPVRCPNPHCRSAYWMKPREREALKDKIVEK